MKISLLRLKQEQLKRRILENNDIFEFNYFCFRDKEGNPWITTNFQLEWWRLIKDHNRIVIFAPIEFAKTEQISRAWTLWQLGHNQNLCGAIISNTSSQATKILGEISEDICTNTHYQYLFPNVKPETRLGKFQKWTDKELMLEREFTGKDFSLQAIGVGGPLLGARLDFVILDDVMDFESSLTQGQRNKVMQWITSTVLSRLAKDGKCIVIMTAWHDDDVGHRLAKEHNFFKKSYKAILDDGSSLWPEQWPISRLEEKRKELGEFEFARQLQNEIFSDEMRRFKRKWFEGCLEQGENYGLVDSYTERDLRVITGVDLAIGKGEEHDFTVFFTLGIDRDGKKRPLNIQKGKMEFSEIINTFKRLSLAFPETTFIVENNAAQDYVCQYLRDTTNIRIKGFTTGKQKADPILGLQGMAIDFENGKWIIPHHPLTIEWIEGFLNWTPSAHTSDIVMASWFADSETKEREPKVRFF